MKPEGQTLCLIDVSYRFYRSSPLPHRYPRTSFTTIFLSRSALHYSYIRSCPLYPFGIYSLAMYTDTGAYYSSKLELSLDMLDYTNTCWKIAWERPSCMGHHGIGGWRKTVRKRFALCPRDFSSVCPSRGSVSSWKSHCSLGRTVCVKYLLTRIGSKESGATRLCNTATMCPHVYTRHMIFFSSLPSPIEDQKSVIKTQILRNASKSYDSVAPFRQFEDQKELRMIYPRNIWECFSNNCELRVSEENMGNRYTERKRVKTKVY